MWYAVCHWDALSMAAKLLALSGLWRIMGVDPTGWVRYHLLQRAGSRHGNRVRLARVRWVVSGAIVLAEGRSHRLGQDEAAAAPVG